MVGNENHHSVVYMLLTCKVSFYLQENVAGWSWRGYVSCLAVVAQWRHLPRPSRLSQGKTPPECHHGGGCLC